MPQDQAPGADAELDLPVQARETAPARRERAPQEAPSAVRPRPAQASSLLTQRAAVEYAYVARDVRHIAAVAGGLVVVLFVLFLLIDVVHVVTF